MTDSISINGRPVDVSHREPDMPLLWYLRDHENLTGTKFGCGRALCGACTVLIDGTPMRSCQTPLEALEGREITTIEGLVDQNEIIRRVWVEQNVAQCGYCQSGQIVAATALLNTNDSPTDSDIDRAMSGNVCRCGTYTRIRKAIHTVASIMRDASSAQEGE